MSFDPADMGRVSRARDIFLSSGGYLDEELSAHVRPEILHSWKRSYLSGVDHQTMSLAEIDVSGRSERLRRAAAPVMDRLREQLEGSAAWGMLLDRDCTQLGRSVGDNSTVSRTESRGSRQGAIFREEVVGTNGAGTGLERLEPFVVRGPEHFRDSEQNIVSVGAPVRDALNRIVGVVTLMSMTSHTNHILLPFARDVAWAIRERMAADAYGDERELFAVFSQQSRRPSQAVIAVSDNVFVANTAARQLMTLGGTADLVAVRAFEAVAVGGDGEFRIDTGDVAITIRYRSVPLRDGRFGAVANISRTVSVSGPGSTVVDSPEYSEPTSQHELLAQAWRSRLPALVTGERSTGRTTLLRAVLHERGTEFDGRTAAREPELWLERLADACRRADAVVVRHIDDVPPALVPSVRAILVESAAWCAATASPGTQDDGILGDLFTFVAECAPLRERRAELGEIISHTIAELRIGGGSVRCSPEVLAILGRQRWQGNLGQLRRVIATAALKARSGEIMLEHLPADILVEAGGRELTKLERLERELVMTSLREASWNREDAAQALGISRATMYRKIKQFGISVPSSRS